ncbi:MAG: hypothetical protein HYV60_01290 [Planctomycetia bacterium]|nr:hypothetical protein [Planctomycetia bacterium]
MIRDGDAWQRIDHDLHGFPHHAGTIRAGVFLVEIWQADPFFGGDEFGYMVQVECVWAEFFLLRDLGELLGLLAELRGIKK